MITRDQIVETAKSLVGVRFRHQGRDRNGVDCVGLLVLIGRELGYEDIKDLADYRRTPTPSVMRAFLEANLDEIPLDDLKPGDVIWMRMGGLKPRHAGVFVGKWGGEDAIVHADGRTNAVRIQYLSDFPRSWFTAGFRLREVAD